MIDICIVRINTLNLFGPLFSSPFDCMHFQLCSILSVYSASGKATSCFELMIGFVGWDMLKYDFIFVILSFLFLTLKILYST